MPVGIRITATVRISVPSGEGVSGPGERVGGEVLRLVVGQRLGRHRTGRRTVAVEDHRVLDRFPLRIQGHGRTLGGREVGNKFLVIVTVSLAVRAGVPSCELITYLGEGHRRQLPRLGIVFQFMRLHLAGSAVGIEGDGVGDGFPSRDESYRCLIDVYPLAVAVGHVLEDGVIV